MNAYLASETLYHRLISIISSQNVGSPTTPSGGRPSWSWRYPASLDPMHRMQESEDSIDEHEIPYLLNSRHPETNWHDKDPTLRKFDYLELQDYGHAFGPYWIAESSLDGDIHHLFRNLVEIPGLKPSLILASKFLSEAKLLPFWHALIFNDYTFLEEETEEIGWPCHKIHLNPDPLSQKDLEKTKAALVRIAKDVSIDSHNHSVFEYCWSFTKRTRRHIKNEHLEGCSGTSSSVTLCPKTLELLHPDTDIPADQRNRIAFMLAVNLCHEFAHAVYMFREPLPLLHNGSSQPPGMTNEVEPFINNDRLPELGHAWESILFGGRLSSLGSRDDCKYGLGLTRWPACDTAHLENPINGTVVPIARVGVFDPKWETLYVIPMDFVENLFNNTYWKVDVKEKGIDALRFPKKLGCRKRNYDWTDQGEDDGYASDDSERGKHQDERGVVRPGQPQLPPSPPLSDLDEDDYPTDDSESFSDYAGYDTDELGEDDNDAGAELVYGSHSDSDGGVLLLGTEDPVFPDIDFDIMRDWLESEWFQLNHPMPGSFPSDVDFGIPGEDGGSDSEDGRWEIGHVEITEDSEDSFVFPDIAFDENAIELDEDAIELDEDAIE